MTSWLINELLDASWDDDTPREISREMMLRRYNIRVDAVRGGAEEWFGYDCLD